MSLITKLLPFVGKVLLFLIVLSLAWPFFAPVYNRLVVEISNGLIRLVERPLITTLKAEGDSVQVYLRGFGLEQPILDYRGYALYFNLVLLIALILATPNLVVLRRLKITLIALSMLLATHIIPIIIEIKFVYAYSGIVPCSDAQRYAYYWGAAFFGAIGEQLFPILIWGTLTFKYWFPELKVNASRPW